MEDEEKQNADTQTATSDVKKQDKTENKSEGVKVKKTTAQKGEDVSITFKNQDELDGFIDRMYAKGAEKAQNDDTSKNKKQAATDEDASKDTSNKSITMQQTIPDDYIPTKIALAMTDAGIISSKAKRASRLVDTNKILDNGIINEEKLKAEIDSVIAEFPELKVVKEEEKEQKGFKFGADNSQSQTTDQKKSIPTKRWNRFNSI